MAIERAELAVFDAIDARTLAEGRAAISPTSWLGMISGILEIFIGFWASQQALPARAVLLIIWVGLFAVFRGVTDIGLAFELKSAQHY